MSSKTFSTSKFILFIIIFLMLGAVSCAPKAITPSPGPVLKPGSQPGHQAEPAEKQKQHAGEPDPRMTASLRLTDQARALIETRRADSAIRILEKAVALNPSNGMNYYYLSEAWLIKGDMVQAGNFNELAAIHLGSDETWRRRIADQKQKIMDKQDK